jgi:hypothetical protein
MQHVVKSLKPTGKAIVVLSQGILFRGKPEQTEAEDGRNQKADAEYRIREGFVESDLIECVIVLPSKIFYGNTVPGCLVVLNKRKPEERKNKILMIWASRHFESANPQNFLRTCDLMRILVPWQAFGDLDKCCKLIPEEETDLLGDIEAERQAALKDIHEAYDPVIEPQPELKAEMARLEAADFAKWSEAPDKSDPNFGSLKSLVDEVVKREAQVGKKSGDEKRVAEHFKQHVQPNGFKAMLACYDKETCVLYKAALDKLLGPEVSLCIFSEAPKEDGELIKAHYLGDATRKKAIDEFKKPKPEKPEELAKPENRFRKVELFIVCDMLLTGFDAPILQTLYLDKGLRNHTLLQAIARVNRPYNELKNGWGEDGTQGRGGLVIDYFGVFENLNEALNFDKNELGTIAYPFSLLRERFKLEIGLLSDLFKDVDRTGSYESLMKALTFLNQNEPARDKFEELYRNVRILYEALQPDEFLADYEREYAWLTKMWMAYRKKFYPAERFEISAEDGGKTRELIRQNVSMEELKKDFPTYELNEQYLSKLKDEPPDAKALDIEAMLAAELRIRLGEDEDYQPLSERLKQIVSNKRQGTLAGIALIAELSKLAEEVVRLTEERKLPLRDQIAKTAWERNPAAKAGAADDVADGILAKADEFCFPNWFQKDDVDTTLYREFTILLAGKFGNLGLHGKGKDFVDRCIKLLKRARYVGKGPKGGA